MLHTKLIFKHSSLSVVIDLAIVLLLHSYWKCITKYHFVIQWSLIMLFFNFAELHL